MQVSLGFWLFGRGLDQWSQISPAFYGEGFFLHWECGSRWQRLYNPITGFGQQGRRLRVVSFVRINSSSEVCFIRSSGSTHFCLYVGISPTSPSGFPERAQYTALGVSFGCEDIQGRWFSEYPMVYTLCSKFWTHVSWLMHLGKWSFSLCDWPWRSVWNDLDALSLS